MTFSWPGLFFITLWVVVSNFAPLWLLLIVLINTTFFLYTEQVARDWPTILVVTLHFSVQCSRTYYLYLFGEG